MIPRPQRTLARPAEVRGYGLFGGRAVVLRLLPAPEHHGIAFQRIDLPGAPRIPALVGYVQPRLRRTALVRGEAIVEVIEHVMAALGGLRIDNCLVQLDAPEPPGCDGSSEAFVSALIDAGIVEQRAPRRICRIEHQEVISNPAGGGFLEFAPASRDSLTITCEIDYPGTPIGAQSFRTEVTPEMFVTQVSFARTFVLEREVEGLRAQGLGLRATTDDLLVFGPDGPIDNELHAGNECARHKLLDCIGDFALLGCDLIGEIRAHQSGHALNHELVRRLSSSIQCAPLRHAG